MQYINQNLRNRNEYDYSFSECALSTCVCWKLRISLCDSELLKQIKKKQFFRRNK
jgi:hypothetical protein